MNIIYRGHEAKRDVIDGKEYWTIQPVGEDNQIVQGPFYSQQAVEDYINFHCDRTGEYPLECEYCNETKDLKRVEVPIWNKQGVVIGHDCQKKSCQSQMAYDFDMGKAMAKGEM